MKKTEETVLTGDRPTGRLHLGHFLGSIENRLKLEKSAKGKLFYVVADVQALTDNAEDPTKVRSAVLEVALDNLACGIDPKKTTMFIQSQVSEIAELTIFLLNLVTVSRLKQNPTVKNEILQKGYGESVPAGFLMYPISQAADILAFKANRIPVGEDQLPVLEQTNELVDSFNRIYGKTFDRIKPVAAKHPRLVGLDGKAKMSKSLGNAIYLSDKEEVVEEKVMKMYTDPKHIRASHPGKVEGNVVFSYLDIFDPNQKELAKLKAQYKKGGLGDIVLKKRLAEILNNFLDPIRDRRRELAGDPHLVMDILEEGTRKARQTAREVLREVKTKMKINYFQ